MSTPKEAIRAHCRVCVGGDVRRVKDCQGNTNILACPLWPVRIKEGKISVKVIRSYCLYCMGGSRELVMDCNTYDCDLHPYRLGINEAHKTRTGRAVNLK